MAGNPDDRRPVALSVDAFRRVRRVTKKIERTPWGGDPRIGWAAPINPGVMRARVTSTIPSGTWSAPSTTGMVQVYHKNFDTDAWEPDGDPQPCVNDQDLGTAGAVVDVTCKVAWISGELWLVQADCNATPIA